MSASPAPSLPPGLPRPVEAVLAACGLLVLAPVFVLTAAAVALTSPGPVFFRQTRIGMGGAPFFLFKFRSMRIESPGRKITARGDSRITPVGRFIRKTKIDELPQLWNVLRGDMSFVGARPEVPEYVNLDDPLWPRVLEARPGLTHPVTLALHSEEELLAKVEGDSEDFYERYLLPYKLRGFLEYLEERSTWRDVSTIVSTLAAILRPGGAEPPTPAEIRAAIEDRTAAATEPDRNGVDPHVDRW